MPANDERRKIFAAYLKIYLRQTKEVFLGKFVPFLIIPVSLFFL